MKKRFFNVISLVLLITVCVAGCATFGRDADSGQVIRVNNQSEPSCLHPQLAEGSHDSWILDHLFEGLVKITADGKISPGMAKEWEVSEDGLTYTFYLRDNIKWSNGDPVTAEDFEYAWKYCLDPRTASYYSYQLYYIKGAEEFNTYAITPEEDATDETMKKDEEELQKLSDALGIKVIDSKTLQVTLERPTPYFLELCSFHTYYPINKKVQEANKDWNKEADTYVSNGPFKLAEWEHKEYILLKNNENYYEKNKVKIKEMQFLMLEDINTAWQMYQNGELDLAYPLPQQVLNKLKDDKSSELVIGNDLATYFYRFNTTRKPFNNVKVRKALSMSIDRNAICEQVAMGGQKPAFGYTPPGIPDANGDYQANLGPLFREDIEEAKKLLADGLKEEGIDKFEFTLLYNTLEGHRRIAEAIQEMWRKNLGIDVKLENVEFQYLLDRWHNLDYDVSFAGWTGDYIDPMTFLDLFASWSTQNDTGWENAEYDSLLRQAQEEMDRQNRMDLLKQAERILMEEMPIMPIYFYTMPYTVKPYVKDVFKPVNKYPIFTYAYIKK